MTSWVASAPGKAVLLGEYAVLDGAPALVQAVNRRCTARLVPVAGQIGRVEALQLDSRPVRFVLDGHGRPRWQDDFPPGFAPAAAVIESVLEYIGRHAGRVVPFALRIDSGALFSGATKLGIGSSGATAVAIDAVLKAAFLEHQGLAEKQESASAAVTRLRAAQQPDAARAGSGIDLAASLCGGMLQFRLAGDAVELEAVRLPRDLSLVFVWAGRPAATSAFLDAWRQLESSSPGDHAELLATMRTLAEAGRRAVADADGAAFLDALAGYGCIMGKMNDLLGQEVMTAGHRHAAAAVQRMGGVYKPCGAGGGDIGLAASDEPDFGRRLRQLAPDLTTLDLQPDEHGVRVEQE